MTDDNTFAGFEPVSAETILESDWPEPEWAIDGWWTRGSYGVVGGAPKSFKSTIALEMFLSLATGVPFLGLFEAPGWLSDGTALIIQDENALPNVRRQLAHTAAARELGKLVEEDQHTFRFQHGRGISNLNLFFLNFSEFSLTEPAHLEWLADWAQRETCRYVLLDPLYMLLGNADENVGREVRPVLRALALLKQEAGCAAIIVHHTGKDVTRRGGRALLGHTYLHGWYEAAMYPASNRGLITVLHEFREMPPQDDHYLVVKEDGQWGQMSEERDSAGRVATQTMAKRLLMDQYRDLVLADAGITDKDAGERLGVGPKTISRYRNLLRAEGLWPDDEEEGDA